MIKSIFITFISIIGMPIYALCVAFLLLLQPLLGWSYVDASVYVCEYFQPIFTAVIALIFFIFATKKVFTALRIRRKIGGVALLTICVSYIAVITYCVNELMSRLSEYAGMTNRQIFDYVVNKLSVMGQNYPSGRFQILDFETVSYGYIMANVEVYIVPISLVLLLGIIQWRISKRISKNENK